MAWKRNTSLCAPMYLCEDVDPSQLESHVIEEEEHRCYGSNMHSALLYIKKYGIPKEASKEFNCMLARGVGADEKRYYISEVLRFPTLEAALMRLKTHPVGATLAMFTGCTDEGIYRGPMKEGSEYMGDHEVVMICCEVKKGEMVVKCKTSYGKKCCNRGYIYVSIEVLLILAGALRKQGAKLGDICHIRPQYLLSDFYSVEMEISSDENRAKNRQFLSSGKSSALESIVGKDFLPRGSDGQSESIVKGIENVVRSYTEKPNRIILAISPANQDRAASDPIIISREVDPSGEITFGVLKDIDLMDKGTDAVDRLGKSSVLESIVGKDSLPRGSGNHTFCLKLFVGIVTRRPLVLKLQTIDDGTREYAEFLHLPRKRFTDFAAVRKEIQDEIDRETGRSKAISSVPIHLSIYSPDVVNLRLIDLPELTKVAVDGQSESIVKGIENVVRSYIEKPNDIILAISPVKKDLASSDAIKISREVYPSGERTFGVLTKIDLVDYGTNAVEILEERSFKLKDPEQEATTETNILSVIPLNEALRKEVERMKMETGEISGNSDSFDMGMQQVQYSPSTFMAIPPYNHGSINNGQDMQQMRGFNQMSNSQSVSEFLQNGRLQGLEISSNNSSSLSLRYAELRRGRVTEQRKSNATGVQQTKRSTLGEAEAENNISCENFEISKSKPSRESVRKVVCEEEKEVMLLGNDSCCGSYKAVAHEKDGDNALFPESDDNSSIWYGNELLWAPSSPQKLKVGIVLSKSQVPGGRTVIHGPCDESKPYTTPTTRSISLCLKS
ncbi:unnamed protein product [Brassica oleracea var. botrytis]